MGCGEMGNISSRARRACAVMLAVLLTCSLCPVAAFGAEEAELASDTSGATGSAVATEATDAAATSGEADEPAAPSDPASPETPGDPATPTTPSEPASPATPAKPQAKPVVTIKTALAGVKGWQTVKAPAKAGRTSGTAAVTAIKLSYKGDLSGDIACKTYQTGKGWSSYAKGGAVSGTKKKANAIQALRIKLTGKLAQQYTVYYRANVVGYGWTGWGKNDEPVGARKLANIRAYQVKLVKKGSKAPGSRANRYFSAGEASAEYYYAKGGLTRPQLIKAIGKAKGSGLKVFGATYKTNTKAMKKLKQAIQQLGRYKLSFVMMDLTTGAGVCYSPTKVQYCASTIKGPYVAAINKFRPGSAAGYQGTMSQTIKVSSNEGYSSLRRRFGHGIMKSMMSYSGVSTSEMQWGRNYAYLSSRTLAKLWIGTYWYYYRETNSRSAAVRGLHAHPLNSFIDRALSTPTRTKPGWYPGGGYNVQNDAGVVLVDGHPYVLAVMSSACGQYGRLANLVRAIDGVHTDMVKAGA